MLSLLSLPCGRRNVMKSMAQHAEFLSAMAPTKYDAFWPLTPDVRCAVVAFNSYNEKIPLEITLNHELKLFTRHLVDDTEICCANPYSLLVELAQVGLVRPKAPAGNWGELYFTLDNGETYIKGFDLTRANAAHFDKPLRTVKKTVLQKT